MGFYSYNCPPYGLYLLMSCYKYLSHTYYHNLISKSVKAHYCCSFLKPQMSRLPLGYGPRKAHCFSVFLSHFGLCKQKPTSLSSLNGVFSLSKLLMKQAHQVFVKMPTRNPIVGIEQPKTLRRSPRFIHHKTTTEPQRPTTLRKSPRLHPKNTTSEPEDRKTPKSKSRNHRARSPDRKSVV